MRAIHAFVLSSVLCTAFGVPAAETCDPHHTKCCENWCVKWLNASGKEWGRHEVDAYAKLQPAIVHSQAMQAQWEKWCGCSWGPDDFSRPTIECCDLGTPPAVSVELLQKMVGEAVGVDRDIVALLEAFSGQKLAPGAAQGAVKGGLAGWSSVTKDFVSNLSDALARVRKLKAVLERLHEPFGKEVDRQLREFQRDLDAANSAVTRAKVFAAQLADAPRVEVPDPTSALTIKVRAEPGTADGSWRLVLGDFGELKPGKELAIPVAGIQSIPVLFMRKGEGGKWTAGKVEIGSFSADDPLQATIRGVGDDGQPLFNAVVEIRQQATPVLVEPADGSTLGEAHVAVTGRVAGGSPTGLTMTINGAPCANLVISEADFSCDADLKAGANLIVAALGPRKAQARVEFTPQIGSLELRCAILGAQLRVTGPNGFAKETAAGKITGLPSGVYRVEVLTESGTLEAVDLSVETKKTTAWSCNPLATARPGLDLTPGAWTCGDFNGKEGRGLPATLERLPDRSYRLTWATEWGTIVLRFRPEYQVRNDTAWGADRENFAMEEASFEQFAFQAYTCQLSDPASVDLRVFRDFNTGDGETGTAVIVDFERTASCPDDSPRSGADRIQFYGP